MTQEELEALPEVTSPRFGMKVIQIEGMTGVVPVLPNAPLIFSRKCDPMKIQLQKTGVWYKVGLHKGVLVKQELRRQFW